MITIQFLIAFQLAILTKSTDGQYYGESCVFGNGEIGVCDYFNDCESAKIDYRKGIRPEICSFLKDSPIICCKKDNRGQITERKRISEEKCEEYKALAYRVIPSLLVAQGTRKVSNCKVNPAASLIKNGETTKLGELPHINLFSWELQGGSDLSFSRKLLKTNEVEISADYFFHHFSALNDSTMAAIGYDDLGEIRFQCGGSLISKNFVLTAAHCIKPRIAIVRLGDQNIYSERDGARHQNVKIKRSIKHENYKGSSVYYDIALLELDRSVTFSPTIRPACLWQNSYVENTGIASGWGLLEHEGQTSEELQKVSLEIMKNEHCKPYFEVVQKFGGDKLKNGIVNSQLCAAAIENGRLVGGRDACQGDSGGPLQVSDKQIGCVYYVLGITSFSAVGCGNEESPGVYTRVSSYIDWIESIVWTN